MKYLSLLVSLALGGCALAQQKITTREGYVKALQRHVSRRVKLPEDHAAFFDCRVSVRQDHEGNITAFEYDVCEEDVSVRNAIGRAIDHSSPLPLPDDMTLFDNDLLFRFCPSCET